MENMDRKDIGNIWITVGERVDTIANNNEEFNEIIDRIIDFINSDEFSFSGLEDALYLASKAKDSIRKDSIVGLFLDRIAPAVHRLKQEKDPEQIDILSKTIDMQIRKISEHCDISNFSISQFVSSEILDQIVPRKEINFQAFSSEAIDIVRNKINEINKAKNEER